MKDGRHGVMAEEDAGETPDEVLARRVQRGEREAFAELARRYLRPIHAVVASFLTEPADVEDAAQETFLRALDRIRTYDAERPFAPWLYQIARNIARNRLSARDRWRTEPTSERLAAGAADPDAKVERREVRALVERAVAGLPEQRRTAFRLFEIEGHTAADVADLMGVAEGTVRAHVHHARRSLRSELGPLLDRGEGA